MLSGFDLWVAPDSGRCSDCFPGIKTAFSSLFKKNDSGFLYKQKHLILNAILKSVSVISFWLKNSACILLDVDGFLC